jgi:hypothetical protein
MECMAGSSLPVMKVAGMGSGAASSKVTTSSELATGGGGTGGTAGWPGSVSRTVVEPAMRIALAGKCASPLAAWSGLEPGGCARISSSVWSWR